jgi:cytochrome b561
MVGLQQVFKSFGLAFIGSMHPRMLWLSLRPFLIVAVLWGCLIWLTWTPALEALSIFLTTSIFTSWIQDGLIWAGFENARAWIAPLFFVMLIIPLSGWLMSSAKGVPTVWFGVLPLPDLLPRDKALGKQLAELHSALNIGLLVLLGVHTAAALLHHLVLKDDILRRMLPVRFQPKP